jgi:hypothetical protein
LHRKNRRGKKRKDDEENENMEKENWMTSKTVLKINSCKWKK